MRELLKELYSLVDTRIDETWKVGAEQHLTELSTSLQMLSEKVLHIGAKAEEQALSSDTDEDRYLSSIIHYDWMKDAKSFLKLWRDVIFEYQKALILAESGEIDIIEAYVLKERSKKTVQEAAEYFANSFDKLSSTHPNAEDYLTNISLKSNPWPVYKEHVSTIESQSHQLLDQYDKLKGVHGHLENLKASLSELIDSYRVEISRIQHLGDQSIDDINTHLSTAPWKLVKILDDLDQQALAANLYNAYTFMVDQICSDMVEEVEVPIHLIHGQPEYKHIDFK